jgi:hypothetical protein
VRDGRTYRTRRWLRRLILAAVSLWSAVAALVGAHPDGGAQARLGACAFLLFFAAYAALYDRAAVRVTTDGFVFQGLFRRVAVRSEEILRVEVLTGVTGTFYAVRTRRGSFRFSSLFAGHRELLGVLVLRAGLERVRCAPSR